MERMNNTRRRHCDDSMEKLNEQSSIYIAQDFIGIIRINYYFPSKKKESIIMNQ